MEFFGPIWKNYSEKIEKNWKDLIAEDDLVLIAGDISWAMRLKEALIDLEWIDKLPGTKLMVRGNHDYWWDSQTKMKAVMPPSIHFLQNDAFTWHGATIGGARLWDTPEYSFEEFIEFQENPKAKEKEEGVDNEKIFHRDLQRLEMSLSKLDKDASLRIAMTHYPPISADLLPSKASEILEKYRVQYCIFGHLHNLKKNKSMFGEKKGITYILTSCDYLDFCPIPIATL